MANRELGVVHFWVCATELGGCNGRLQPGSSRFDSGQLFISVSLFSSKWGQQKNSKSFTWTAMASAHARQWKSIQTSQQVFIGFKNLPAGYFRDLQTSGQSMCSNGRLAIETSIKNLRVIKLLWVWFSGRCTSSGNFTAAQSWVDPYSGFYSREIAIHTVFLWILLGGKPKWLPLNFGFNDVMRTAPKYSYSKGRCNDRRTTAEGTARAKD